MGFDGDSKPERFNTTTLGNGKAVIAAPPAGQRLVIQSIDASDIVDQELNFHWEGAGIIGLDSNSFAGGHIAALGGVVKVLGAPIMLPEATGLFVDVINGSNDTIAYIQYRQIAFP